jgi:hypothetical protein
MAHGIVERAKKALALTSVDFNQEDIRPRCDKSGRYSSTGRCSSNLFQSTIATMDTFPNATDECDRLITFACAMLHKKVGFTFELHTGNKLTPLVGMITSIHIDQR